jgi:hypothetical protein
MLKVSGVKKVVLNSRKFSGKREHMEAATFYGIMIILVGLIEVFITPTIMNRFMKRYTDRLQPEQYERVIRATRRSGVIVVILGLTLVLGLWGRSF